MPLRLVVVVVELHLDAITTNMTSAKPRTSVIVHATAAGAINLSQIELEHQLYASHALSRPTTGVMMY